MRDDLHVQGCLILSQVGLLFPVNHAPEIADRIALSNGASGRTRTGAYGFTKPALSLLRHRGEEMRNSECGVWNSQLDTPHSAFNT